MTPLSAYFLILSTLSRNYRTSPTRSSLGPLSCWTGAEFYRVWNEDILFKLSSLRFSGHSAFLTVVSLRPRFQCKGLWVLLEGQHRRRRCPAGFCLWFCSVSCVHEQPHWIACNYTLTFIDDTMHHYFSMYLRQAILILHSAK